MTGTYVYCVVQAARRPVLPAALAPGLDGLATPRLLQVARDLWAVVADAPLERFEAAAIERGLRDLDWVAAQAQAHEAVVEAWLDAALVPLRLFTIYAGDARAVEALGERAEAIREAARASKGCREWTLRVLLDPARAQAAARSRAAAAPEAEPQPGSAGRAFLARKQRERDTSRQASAFAREEAQAAVAALAAQARRTLPGAAGSGVERLVAEATFLVPRATERRFLAAADAACARLEEVGCEARVSGPWPPYQVAGVVGAAGAGAAS